MPVFTEDKRTHETKAVDNVQALVQLLRNRSYEEIRQRMYDSAPGSPWWSACKAELDLRNGQQLAEASVAMSRVTEKMRSSTQHFEQLAETLCQATNDVADLLRKTEAAGRRLSRDAADLRTKISAERKKPFRSRSESQGFKNLWIAFVMT